MGRGCPVDWNEKEGRYNWELVFCELYAGGKYDNEERAKTTSFPWASTDWAPAPPSTPRRYMDVTVWREGKEYTPAL